MTGEMTVRDDCAEMTAVLRSAAAEMTAKMTAVLRSAAAEMTAAEMAVLRLLC
jgi:hypothetical protein